MASTIRIGLIGDRQDTVPAHRAIPLALHQSGTDLGLPVEYDWLPTPQITAGKDLESYHGLWCVPASPYQSESGALLAIRYARENALPFLGTCGGFQHALLEYARDVLHWREAAHAESDPETRMPVVSPLSCALVEVSGALQLTPGSHLARAYGTPTAVESYHCRYGLNPAFRESLLAASWETSAVDEHGEVRAVELRNHPFFVATLFQPERAALENRPIPLARAFVSACAQRRGS